MQPFDVKLAGVMHFPLYFVAGIARGDASRQVWRVRGKTGGSFFDDDEVAHFHAPKGWRAGTASSIRRGRYRSLPKFVQISASQPRRGYP